MQMDLCPGLEWSMRNYLIISFAEPNEKKLYLARIKLQFILLLDPVIQADTPNKQCLNFSRDSLAFETDKDM